MFYTSKHQGSSAIKKAQIKSLEEVQVECIITEYFVRNKCNVYLLINKYLWKTQIFRVLFESKKCINKLSTYLSRPLLFLLLNDCFSEQFRNKIRKMIIHQRQKIVILKLLIQFNTYFNEGFMGSDYFAPNAKSSIRSCDRRCLRAIVAGKQFIVIKFKFGLYICWKLYLKNILFILNV